MNADEVKPKDKPSLDDTQYLLSTEANIVWLDEAILEAKRYEGVEIKLEDIWK